jgi:hypothetical protein
MTITGDGAARCPRCGEEREPGFAVCWKCGHSFAPGTADVDVAAEPERRVDDAIEIEQLAPLWMEPLETAGRRVYLAGRDRVAVALLRAAAAWLTMVLLFYVGIFLVPFALVGHLLLAWLLRRSGGPRGLGVLTGCATLFLVAGALVGMAALGSVLAPHRSSSGYERLIFLPGALAAVVVAVYEYRLIIAATELQRDIRLATEAKPTPGGDAPPSPPAPQSPATDA